MAGVVLDVAPTEPLPNGDPVWTMDNSMLVPHSASTSTRENERLTELFCDNVRCYVSGAPLRNVYSHERGYWRLR